MLLFYQYYLGICFMFIKKLLKNTDQEFGAIMALAPLDNVYIF